MIPSKNCMRKNSVISILIIAYLNTVVMLIAILVMDELPQCPVQLLTTILIERTSHISSGQEKKIDGKHV